MTTWHLGAEDMVVLEQLAKQPITEKVDLQALADSIEKNGGIQEVTHSEWHAIIASLRYAHIAKVAVLGNKSLKSLHKAIAISDKDPADNANPFRTTP